MLRFSPFLVSYAAALSMFATPRCMTVNAKQVSPCSNVGEVSYESYDAADKVIPFSEECTAKKLTSFKICESGKWSEICDSNFTKSDATVMCRELGHSDIGVRVYEFPQYIGVSRMHSQYPECSGNESRLSNCLAEHRQQTVMCLAKRVVVVCFPVTMDPMRDLELCGFEIPYSYLLRPTTLETDGQIYAGLGVKSLPIASRATTTGSSFVISDSFSVQNSKLMLIVFCLGVAMYATV